MGKRAKVIKLLLEDGSLNNVIKIAEDEWIGRLYSIPRDKAKDFIKNNNISDWGIYLLLSSDCVYVGQSKNLKVRIMNHLLHKNWWETVVILTNNDNTFNKSDIDYLENKLIEKAKNLNTLDIDNIKSGNPAKVDEFRETTLNQFLEESLFLLEFIGVRVFSVKNKYNISNIIPVSTEENIKMREKNEVINYLKDHGIDLNKNATYARIQKDKNAFWLNPNISNLSKKWSLVLNNYLKNEIYILEVPANIFQATYPREKNKLLTRKDDNRKLELLIDATDLMDRYSSLSFKKYIINKIKY